MIVAQWLGVAAFGFAVDVSWTRYTQAVNAKAPHRAAWWSVAIFLTGAANVVAYTTDRWLLIPACIGAFAGTFYAVRREVKEQPDAKVTYSAH